MKHNANPPFFKAEQEKKNFKQVLHCNLQGDFTMIDLQTYLENKV